MEKTDQLIKKYADGSIFSEDGRSNIVFRQQKSLESLLEEYRNAELSELQGKYDKLKEVFEIAIRCLIVTSNFNRPMTSFDLEKIKQDWRVRAGLKEQ